MKCGNCQKNKTDNIATMGQVRVELTADQPIRIGIAPEMAPGYLNLAVHLERMKRFPEAVEAYEKFLELSSEEEFAHQREIAAAAIKRLKAR